MLIHEEYQDMDMVPPIPIRVWVYGQGLASIGHSQYNGILSIQATEHQNSKQD